MKGASVSSSMRGPISLVIICLTRSDVFRFVEYVITPEIVTVKGTSRAESDGGRTSNPDV